MFVAHNWFFDMKMILELKIREKRLSKYLLSQCLHVES